MPWKGCVLLRKDDGVSRRLAKDQGVCTTAGQHALCQRLNGPMMLFIDNSLDFVLEQTRITQPCAHRRLNAFENTITNLVKRWRPRLPLVPDREVRMSDETRETLLAWVEAEETGRGHTLTRLAVYAAGEPITACPRDGCG
jgi:hypothetical protein